MKRRFLIPFILAPLAYALVRAVAVARVRHYESLDAGSADLPGVRLYLRGRRVHLTIDGQGPPLLLLHGFGSSGAAFRPLTRHLGPSMTMIAPDLPGWGYSERAPNADHSHAAHAALMLELLDRLGVGKLMVIGHGTGAAIAIRMALAAPDRIIALMLSGRHEQEPSIHPWFWPVLVPVLPLLIETRRGQRLLQWTANGRGHRIDEQLITSHLEEAHTFGHAATFFAILTATRRSPSLDLDSLSVPKLVIAGDEQPSVTATRIVRFCRQVGLPPTTQSSGNPQPLNHQAGVNRR
jgi:pimeloyl-ACP methyl ester carboxylesterase